MAYRVYNLKHTPLKGGHCFSCQTRKEAEMLLKWLNKVDKTTNWVYA